MKVLMRYVSNNKCNYSTSGESRDGKMYADVTIAVIERRR